VKTYAIKHTPFYRTAKMEKNGVEYLERQRSSGDEHNNVELHSYFKENSYDVHRLSEAARSAIDFEHSLSFREAARMYPWAIAFSIGISTTVSLAYFQPSVLPDFELTPFVNSW